MQACLLELSQYHFPDVCLDKLKQHPYYNYTQMYYKLSAHLHFYKGYLHPSALLKAKIYRAIHLAHDQHANNFIIFTSEDGLIIKCEDISNETFNGHFEQHLDDPDTCVFIPKGCQQLNQYEFPYYRKLLLTFVQNLPELEASVLTFSGNNPDFLFVSCNTVHNLDLNQLWTEYLNGGLLRKHTLPLNQIPSALRVFGWKYRHSFKIINKSKVTLMVKCTSLEKWHHKLKQITSSQEDFKLIKLISNISSSQEAFGIIRILQQAQQDVSLIAPLVNTNRVLVPLKQAHKVKEILNTVRLELDSVEGVEIFTQTDFNQMNLWAQYGLVKAPSKYYYSFLHLIEYNSEMDPLTRKEYSDEFQEQLQEILKQTQGIFMYKFPPSKFDPQLITTQTDEFIECQLEWSEQHYLFWRIPNFKDTENASITMQAVQTLIIKWTDGTLFKGYKPDSCMHIMLAFHPQAYYVFKESTYPEQADQLQEQIKILESIR